jgi:hypothetical protein
MYLALYLIYNNSAQFGVLWGFKMHAQLQFAANTTVINSEVKIKTRHQNNTLTTFFFLSTMTFKIYELSLYTSDVTAFDVSEKKNPPIADCTRPNCRPLTLKVVRTIFVDFCTDILSRILLPVS